MATYQTSDLYLSAFLKAKGLKVINTSKNGSKSIFVFADREDRENLIREFFNDGLVNITAYKNALQDLKTMLFNI